MPFKYLNNVYEERRKQNTENNVLLFPFEAIIAAIDSKTVSIERGLKLTINGFDLKMNFSNRSVAIWNMKKKAIIQG